MCKHMWIYAGILTQKYTQTHTHTKCTHHRFFQLVGFYTANKEWLTHTERPHQHLEGTFELAAQSGRALPRLNTLQTHNHTVQIILHILPYGRPLILLLNVYLFLFFDTQVLKNSIFITSLKMCLWVNSYVMSTAVWWNYL